MPSNNFRTIAHALKAHVNDTYMLLNAADAVESILPDLAPAEAPFGQRDMNHDVLVYMTIGHPVAMDYMVKSQKINAIKEVRSLAGVGLVSAKNAVEDERVIAERDRRIAAAQPQPDEPLADWERDLLTDDPAKMRAASGAAWLDRNIAGWEDRINIDTLEMWSGAQCLLAQATGEFYFRAVKTYNLTENEASRLGFNDTHDDDLTVTYDELDDAWKALIKARRDVADISRGLDSSPWTSHHETDEPPF